jgi:hypothetical protein
MFLVHGSIFEFNNYNMYLIKIYLGIFSVYISYIILEL